MKRKGVFGQKRKYTVRQETKYALPIRVFSTFSDHTVRFASLTGKYGSVGDTCHAMIGLVSFFHARVEAKFGISSFNSTFRI